MRDYFLYIFLVLFISCAEETPQTLEKGTYRAVLHVQDQEEMPFLFEVIDKKFIKIYNADEIILVDEISYKNDSVFIQTPVYEGYIKAKINKNGLSGSFIKSSLNRIVPFTAVKSTERFPIKSSVANNNITGNWETVFSPDTKDGRYIAKGTFKQIGQHVTGTFRTTTGDYRYLEGVVDGDSLKLSTFDGAHAFLFTAKVTDTTLTGFFYSGNHFKEPFSAKRNNNYELPNEEDLTFLKKGYKKLAFSFPNQKGEMIS